MRQDAVTPAQRALAEKLRSVVPRPPPEFREFRVGDIIVDGMLCHANDNISVFLLALYAIQG